MHFQNFGEKQIQTLTWWMDEETADCDGIICDGSIRSGKTLAMSVGFVWWAMTMFDGCKFALCGKTIEALRRNVVSLLPQWMEGICEMQERRSDNTLLVRGFGHSNVFHEFGGKDESSYTLIQCMTLAGVLFDEVALMPRSFVEQTAARCSVTGSRLWFSCNPESPGHWFYREWIEKAEEKKVLRLQFAMTDNPGLSPEVLERYQTMFEGTFYRRFVLGEWVAAEGIIYDFFDESYVSPVPEGEMEQWYISCDYGTVNPTSMGLWGKQNGVWYRVAEYYYDARQERKQKTDEEHADALEKLAGGRRIEAVVADPSAASFLETLRRRGWRVRRADNEVLSGIRLTARLLKARKLVICQPCRDAIREFSLYRWEDKGDGQDRVKKEYDHAMDEIRYFASTIVGKERNGGFFAGCVERKTR